MITRETLEEVFRIVYDLSVAYRVPIALISGWTSDATLQAIQDADSDLGASLAQNPRMDSPGALVIAALQEWGALPQGLD